MIDVSTPTRQRLVTRMLPAIFIGLMASSSLAAAATGGRYAACPACAPQDLVWADGEFDQIHLVPNAVGTDLQAQTVAPEVIAKALNTLRFKEAGGWTPLLDEEGAASLAQGLSKALARAGAKQEAIFLVTSKMSGGLFGVKLGNSGRAFVDANGLNIVVGEAHVEFVAPYRATRMERQFNFGSRSTASGVLLESEAMKGLRGDWMVLPLAAASAKPQAASLAPAAPQSSARDEQYYAAQEMRLKGLKRLHEQKLITDEEFQAKRGEILKDW